MIALGNSDCGSEPPEDAIIITITGSIKVISSVKLSLVLLLVGKDAVWPSSFFTGRKYENSETGLCFAACQTKLFRLRNFKFGLGYFDLKWLTN